MRKHEKDQLRGPSRTPPRSRKRGRKRIRIQAKRLDGCKSSSWMLKNIAPDEWGEWFGKYCTVKDAEQACVSYSQSGTWGRFLQFRVHPEDVAKYG